MYNRLAKRKDRSSQIVSRALLMNDACRLKLRSTRPSAKHQREIFNNVQQKRSKSTAVETLYCVVCGATESKFCYCGAACVPKCNMAELKAFMAFATSARNPMLHFWDPQDQNNTMQVFTTLGADSAKEFVRLVFIMAMISNAAVLEEIGEDLKTRRIDYLENMFKQRRKDKKSTFRGGQCPGAVKVEGLAHALGEYCDKCLRKLAPFLLAWQEAGADQQGCVRQVRQILLLNEKAKVYGFGCYKRKKFAEFLVVAAMGNVFGLHFEEEWLSYLSDLWPIPSNSVTNLKRIFPGIRNRRAGIVALKRGLRKSRFITFSAVVAQLCFWSEQRNGRINWL